MNTDIQQILAQAKELLKDEMSQISHKTWIEPLKIASIVDNNVVLVSEDSFKRDMADTKFHDLIMNTFSFILQKNCNISIVCENEITDLEIIIDDENPYYKTENNLILTKDGKEVITYISKKSTDIVVPEGVEKLNAQAFKKSDITGIHLPSTLKEIGNECFRECFYITEIDIPNSVQTIADTAFDGCGYITEIRIDKSRGSISGSPWSVPKGESCYKYQQFLQKIFLNYLQKKYVMV